MISSRLYKERAAQLRAALVTMEVNEFIIKEFI
jgi:hypothetical protein